MTRAPRILWPVLLAVLIVVAVNNLGCYLCRQESVITAAAGQSYPTPSMVGELKRAQFSPVYIPDRLP